MQNLERLALIYEIPAASWQDDAAWPSSTNWQELRTNFLIEPLRPIVRAWRGTIQPAPADENGGEGRGGDVLVFRYFAGEDDELTTTWAVFLPDGGWSGLQGKDFYGIERRRPAPEGDDDNWHPRPLKQLGKALGPKVRRPEDGGYAFQPLGRAALIAIDPPPGESPLAEASRLLRNSATLGGDESHWYRPDSARTAVLGTTAGFVVFSSAVHFVSRNRGDLPTQFERFLLLHGLAHAYRRALTESSRQLAEMVPGKGTDDGETETCYRQVRELYDRHVQFEARCYLYSNPVEEASAECSGMARFTMRRQGIDQLRADLHTQLGLAQRYLAEREADRREQEAKATARRQRWLNGIVTVIGLALAAGQTWFGWLGVGGG